MAVKGITAYLRIVYDGTNGGVAEEFHGGFGDVDADGLLKKYMKPLTFFI